MKIEKLIEQLQKSADFEDYPVVASFAAIIEKKYLREAATALEQLQAENDRFRRERDAAVESWRGFCSQCAWKNHQYLADGKMDDMCRTCRDNAKCNWKWRGLHKEE